MPDSRSPQAWTITDAKARLSEILRRAEEEGPQCIGRKKRFIVVPEARWLARSRPRQSLGRWLIDHLPRGVELELPDRREPEREIPFPSRAAK